MDILANLYDCLVPAGVDEAGEQQYTIDLEVLEKNHPTEYQAYMTYVYSVIDENLEDGTLDLHIELSNEDPITYS